MTNTFPENYANVEGDVWLRRLSDSDPRRYHDTTAHWSSYVRMRVRSEIYRLAHHFERQGQHVLLTNTDAVYTYGQPMLDGYASDFSYVLKEADVTLAIPYLRAVYTDSRVELPGVARVDRAAFLASFGEKVQEWQPTT